MTPNDVEILIHCYCCQAPHPRIYAPAVREAIEQFVAEGVLAETEQPNEFRTTKLGEALVKAICNTPMPRMAFIDSHGTVIP